TGLSFDATAVANGGGLLQVYTSTASGRSAPVGKGIAKIFSFVRENLELDLAAVHAHVSTNASKEVFCGHRRLIVRIGKVLGGWENDLRIEHATAPKYRFQPTKTLVYPLTLFVSDR